MDVSILICTYNRADELRRSLDGHAALIVPPSIQWEVVVVDNNSTDGTRDAVREYEGRLPVRYIFEERQGQSRALNRGFSECRGGLILMTDDDTDVTPDWLAAYARAAEKFPEAVFFGGKIKTRWESPPPEWLTMNADWLASSPALDWGDEPKLLTRESRSYVVGANMAIRRSVFGRDYSFREDLGSIGSDTDDSAQHSGQEGDWQRRILATGQVGVYVPEALLYHRERAYRGTRRYVRWIYRNMGVDIRRCEGIPAVPSFLSAPRYLWRRLLVDGARYYYHRVLSSPRVWLKLDCDVAKTRGEILECRRVARERKKADSRGGAERMLMP